MTGSFFWLDCWNVRMHFKRKNDPNRAIALANVTRGALLRTHDCGMYHAQAGRL